MGTTGWFATVRGDAWTLPRLKGQETQSVVWFGLLIPGGVAGPDVAQLPSAPGWSSLFIRHVDYDVAAVEQSLVDSIIAADTVGLIAYVETSDYAYVSAVAGGAARARLVAKEVEEDEYEEHWALRRCRDFHGHAWWPAAAQSLADWSVHAPRPVDAATVREVVEWDAAPAESVVAELWRELGFSAPRPYKSRLKERSADLDAAIRRALDAAEADVRAGGRPMDISEDEDWNTWKSEGPNDWHFWVDGFPTRVESGVQVELRLWAYNATHETGERRTFVLPEA